VTERLRVAVLDYDAGNVRSAKRGFDAAGADAFITGDPQVAEQAQVLVVPGVGNFASCLAHLRRSGLERLLRTWIGAGRPVFGICVGMQMLYEVSDEGDEPGLGLLAGRVERFPSEAIVPHLGWDVVHAAAGHADDPLLAGVAGERLYFVHSYYAVPAATNRSSAAVRTAVWTSPAWFVRAAWSGRSSIRRSRVSSGSGCWRTGSRS
jgi:imidazole glycerol-phosphate synthase subunit HisH